MKLVYRFYHLIGSFFSHRRLFPAALRRLALCAFVNMQSKEIKSKKLPYTITYFVTNQCCLKCAHCFYRNETNKTYNLLSLEEISRICESLKGKIAHIVLTGGEPFLRLDLGEIARLFGDVAGVRIATIPTSGYFPDRLKETFSYLLNNTKMLLNCQLSLDGPEPIHNSIRGDNSAFSKFMESFDALSELRKRFGRNRIPFIHIVTTISKANKDLLPEIAGIGRRLPGIEHSFGFIRGTRAVTFGVNSELLSNFEPLHDIYLSSKEMEICFEQLDNFVWKRKNVGFYERLNREVMRARIEIHKNQNYPGPCYSGYESFILYPDGGLARCEMLKEMGNVRNAGCDIPAFLELKQSENFFKKTTFCFCGHECNLVHFVKHSKESLERLFSD